ncbi:hypothetical protein [Halodesulfovibrio marinisediminis]|uniref:Uncharacterized protein n=1 Tax=Halodesulfovibrio marinisediminis DSM 17456 TaxID=1121457 RepID=A0A1N6E9J9_9BACT|nr:hypothetical protein [Halodesulfovibrio marinisediminis]SIN79631.1 hypothetical protein SAMN02745161_0809 [Halodesulfovibrio marinisediminis DSM 17456]
MEDLKKLFEEKKAQLEQLRDEVALKAHLGKAEVKEEADRLEKELDLFVAKYKPMVKEAGITAEKTGAALGVAADELKAGYEKIRKML